jgi:hypothetical protein
MLDKCLSDEAVEMSKFWNGKTVTIYEYDLDNNLPVRDIVVEGNRVSEAVALESMEFLGSPTRWGFSHPINNS